MNKAQNQAKADRIIGAYLQGKSLEQIADDESDKKKNIHATIYRYKLRTGQFEHTRHEKGYWMSEAGTAKIYADASRFMCRNDFKKSCPKSYDAAGRFGHMDKCCEHMRRANSGSDRLIYILKGRCKETNEYCVYVGLTHCLQERMKRHHIHKKLNNIRVAYKTDLMAQDEAVKFEAELVSRVKSEFSFKCVNGSGGGELGTAGSFIDRDYVEKCAANSNSATEFGNKYCGAANHAKKNGYYFELEFKKPRVSAPNGYWKGIDGAAEALRAAKQCKSRSEFQTNYVCAYSHLKNWPLLQAALPKSAWAG